MIRFLNRIVYNRICLFQTIYAFGASIEFTYKFEINVCFVSARIMDTRMCVCEISYISRKVLYIIHATDNYVTDTVKIL